MMDSLHGNCSKLYSYYSGTTFLGGDHGGFSSAMSAVPFAPAPAAEASLRPPPDSSIIIIINQLRFVQVPSAVPVAAREHVQLVAPPQSDVVVRERGHHHRQGAQQGPPPRPPRWRPEESQGNGAAFQGRQGEGAVGPADEPSRGIDAGGARRLQHRRKK